MFKLRYAMRGAVWVILYLLFILVPLLALLVVPLPPARDFWTEFSVAIGYVALAMMGLQFGLTARFRHITEPWGEDVIYHLHRQISLIAVLLAVAHPLILFSVRPDLIVLLNSIHAPWRARFAALSTYALIALVVTALWRRRWNIRYEIWHLSHIILAVVAVAAAMLHMVGWSFYLTSFWKRELWIGLTIFWIGLLLYVRIIKPLFLLRRPYRITGVRQERGDAWTLAMQPDGHSGFHFSAGQFGWLTVWGSPFKITGHPFSFSSSAAVTGGRVEMTIRNLGDFTSAIHKVPVGKRVYLDGPYGAFTIDRNPADLHVLIAGGAGITPLMSMIRTLADGGDTRPIILLYGSKDWDSITFREELEALKRRINLTIVHVLQDRPVRSTGETRGIDPGVLEDPCAEWTGETAVTAADALEDPWPGWTGETGFIGAGVLKRHLPPPYADHEYFICGPNVMMDAIEKAIGELGVPLWKYHSERYNFV